MSLENKASRQACLFYSNKNKRVPKNEVVWNCQTKSESWMEKIRTNHEVNTFLYYFIFNVTCKYWNYSDIMIDSEVDDVNNDTFLKVLIFTTYAMFSQGRVCVA